MPSNYLIHAKYASQYYDPVKAHEYYMEHRVLKGYDSRGSKVSLNEEGKNAKEYAIKQLQAKKAQDTATAQNYKKSSTESAQANKKNETEKEQKNRDERIANYADSTAVKIAALQSKIKQVGSAANKERVKVQLQKEIDKLREDNAAMKDNIRAEYAETAADISESYNKTIGSITSTYNAAVDKIKADFESTKMSELQKIYDNPEFTKKSKSKSSKSKSSGSSSKKGKSNFSLTKYVTDRRKKLGVKYK